MCVTIYVCVFVSLHAYVRVGNVRNQMKCVLTFASMLLLYTINDKMII